MGWEGMGECCSGHGGGDSLETIERVAQGLGVPPACLLMRREDWISLAFDPKRTLAGVYCWYEASRAVDPVDAAKGDRNSYERRSNAN